jgi:type I restriction enzyme S subunit
MIDGLKPYPAMKGSGVPWLGEVPEHWATERAKWLFRKMDRPVRDSDEVVTCFRDGTVTLRRNRRLRRFTESLKEIGYQGIRRGDLVVHAMDAFAGAIGVADADGKGTPVYSVCEAAPAADAHYYAYMIREMARSQWIQALAKGIRERSTDFRFEAFASQKIPLPPLPEQATIVRFLEHVDRRIRRYIRAKQKLIKLLEEQKQAIIHRAVTRGLDPNVRLKPSGVEWLGDVPEHWEIHRIKQTSQILRGKFTHRPRNDPSLYDGPYPFIQTGDVARAKKSITDYKQTLNERGLAVSKMFPAGTLVMTIAANIGDVAVLEFDACFPDSVVGFVPRGTVERDYLYYVFRAMKPELLREAPVNTQGNLNVDRIGSRGIGLPPLPEQSEIVQHIEASTLELVSSH